MCHSNAGQDLATKRVVLTEPEKIQLEVLRRLSVERATQRRKRVSKTVKIRQFILSVPKGIESEEGIKSNRSQPPTTPISPSVVTKNIATKILIPNIVTNQMQ